MNGDGGTSSDESLRGQSGSDFEQKEDDGAGFKYRNKRHGTSIVLSHTSTIYDRVIEVDKRKGMLRTDPAQFFDRYLKPIEINYDQMFNLMTNPPNQSTTGFKMYALAQFMECSKLPMSVEDLLIFVKFIHYCALPLFAYYQFLVVPDAAGFFRDMGFNVSTNLIVATDHPEIYWSMTEAQRRLLDPLDDLQHADIWKQIFLLSDQ
uniref:Uncharacterized protein n=1 Tax=Panagrolaimus superbus TaxID=310955 RepID=A0A914YGE7_9BILA